MWARADPKLLMTRLHACVWFAAAHHTRLGGAADRVWHRGRPAAVAAQRRGFARATFSLFRLPAHNTVCQHTAPPNPLQRTPLHTMQSTALACILSNPMEVVKTRMQMQGELQTR